MSTFKYKECDAFRKKILPLNLEFRSTKETTKDSIDFVRITEGNTSAIIFFGKFLMMHFRQ